MSAPKGNKFAKGNRGGGRPSIYRPQYAEIARKMCFGGATNADLAMRFGVAQSTISRWMFEYGDFSEAVQSGKDWFDHHIEMILAQRARGYDYIAQKVCSFQGHNEAVDYREHVPADGRALKLWLTRRKPEEWSN